MDPFSSVHSAFDALKAPPSTDLIGESLSELSLASPIVARSSFVECRGRTEIQKFIESRGQVPPQYLPFLSLRSAEQYEQDGTRLFLSECGRGGYGLSGDELVSVFSQRGAKLGSHIAHDAIERGARRLDTLDVNGKVVRLYLQAGFREVQRIPWNDAYAPTNWSYEMWGRPDLVLMRVPGVQI
ncbi:MAG: hypothetical protein J0M12_16815 [Deltaproteobacteria bacterium]|nr:hypothetical protein [Deltaproteobacteria bacterium]